MPLFAKKKGFSSGTVLWCFDRLADSVALCEPQFLNSIDLYKTLGSRILCSAFLLHKTARYVTRSENHLHRERAAASVVLQMSREATAVQLHTKLYLGLIPILLSINRTPRHACQCSIVTSQSAECVFYSCSGIFGYFALSKKISSVHE